MRLISVGFGNSVSAERIIAIVSPDSSPIRRIIQEAKEKGMLIDASCGRRTRAVIIADSDHIILSALQPETISNRLSSKEETPMTRNDERRFACCFRAGVGKERFAKWWQKEGRMCFCLFRLPQGRRE